MNESIIAMREKIHECRARLMGHEYQAKDHMDMARQHLAECEIIAKDLKNLERGFADFRRRLKL